MNKEERLALLEQLVSDLRSTLSNQLHDALIHENEWIFVELGVRLNGPQGRRAMGEEG